MKRAPWACLLALAELATSCGAARPRPSENEDQSWGLVNVRILGHPEAHQLLIRGRRVAAIGGPIPSGTERVDGGGGLVVPAFRDAHTHLYSGALSLDSAAIDTATSVAALQAILQRYAAAHPDRPWIIGRGFSYDLFGAGQEPDRALIDQVVADRPVFLESYDGHSAWVNSRALAAAGLDAAARPSEVPPEQIKRDPSGAPTGYLLEDAMQLVETKIPAPSFEEQLTLLERGLEHCSRLGIVEAGELIGDRSLIDAYLELDRRGRLPIRVVISPPLEGDLAPLAERRDRLRSDRLSFGPLKLFLDGVIETKTAALLAPYATGGGSGGPLIDRDPLYAKVEDAVRHGFAVRIHAIGDAAVRLALDAFQQAPAPPGLHHQIEHIELLDPVDAPRFAQLGVIASMQPFHANPFGDHPERGAWSENLGPARLPRTFAWRTLLDQRASLVFGSDWPVMSADPLQGIAVAVTRADRLSRPAGGWNRAQAVSFGEALRAYTGRARVEVGELADLVVLHQKIDPADPRTLWLEQGVQQIIFEGRRLRP